MSHYSQVRTMLEDRELLIECLKELFQEVEQHWQPQNLYGYQGDKRVDCADIIVRRQYIGPLSNDLGFRHNVADGVYELIVSDYDRPSFGAAWLGRLTQAYATKQVLKTAKRRRFTAVKNQLNSDGSRTLLLRRTR